MAKTEKKLIANNKKAYHDYFILEKYEAGLVLHGTEVKSLRMGKCSIKEAFIRVEDGEMYIYGMHISPYEKGNIFNKDPLRVRKLLLHSFSCSFRSSSWPKTASRRLSSADRCCWAASMTRSGMPSFSLMRKALDLPGTPTLSL